VGLPRGTLAGRLGAVSPAGGTAGGVGVLSAGRRGSGGGAGVGLNRTCQASNTATDSAIAISARFSITFWSSCTPARLRQRMAHRIDQLGKGMCERSGAGDEAEPDPLGRRQRLSSSVRLSEASPRSVPHHAASEPATDCEAYGARAGLPSPQQHERGALHARPASEEPIELRSGPEPLRPREPRAGARHVRHLSSPSADAAPWRAGASAPSGRPLSPCARGTRASSRAGDGSVGTSASRLPPSARNAHSLPILQMPM
jgi:hypothetical protein